MSETIPEDLPALGNALAIAIERRRTFAIISHPDAGKTTLTEKLLLYAGQIEVAGAVRGRKTGRAATSDWMGMERERGISISSTALSFTYRGHVVNLLDTPGHHDFSEDTYRTLAVADSAVMVLDAVNGVEGQTKKLFRVCAARKIPILTFINKMDRPGKLPLDLLAEIETVLGIEPVPVNWPIGTGEAFSGVYDRLGKRILLFSPTERGSVQVPTRIGTWDDVEAIIGKAECLRCQEEIELLDGATGEHDRDKFLAGKQTPVFFGSAATNYGIEPFLDEFLKIAPRPGHRIASGVEVLAERPEFAGQVFKIQANLNPKHRDRIAYLRVCAGTFTPEIEPIIARTGERLRMKGSHRLFARERDAVEEAFPGDVVGIAFTKGVRLGDTLFDGPPLAYDPLPQFSPECFASIRCADTNRRKQMIEGLGQLADEGAIQVFTDPENVRELILAAVGELQFDVVRYRLESEYGVKTEVVPMVYRAGAWIGAHVDKIIDYKPGLGMRMVHDHRGRAVMLSDDAFTIRYVQNKEPWLELKPFSDTLLAPA